MAKEEQDLRLQVQDKREELLKPLLDRVNQAIQDVGKENGYAMIFDASIPNTVLFVAEKDDVMALVKAKLGVK